MSENLYMAKGIPILHTVFIIIFAKSNVTKSKDFSKSAVTIGITVEDKHGWL